MPSLNHRTAIAALAGEGGRALLLLSGRKP